MKWLAQLLQKLPRQTRVIVQTCLYGLAAGSGIPQLKLAFWKDFGALITWVLGASVFIHTGRLGVFSLGYDDLSSGLAGDLGWQLAAILLISTP